MSGSQKTSVLDFIEGFYNRRGGLVVHAGDSAVTYGRD
jgi:hypothetical protein